ncbi:MAG: SPFH domain-containing protein [Bacteroidota bacterium]
MGLLFRRFEVLPDQVGVMYRNNRDPRDLGPGIYRVFDPGRRVRVVTLSTALQAFPVHAQEALTQDGIAFRFSYTVRYAVTEAAQALAQVDLGAAYLDPLAQVHALVHAYVQAAVKDRVAALTSEQITDDRAVLADLRTPALDAQATALGVEVAEVLLRDVTFPKAIQALFSKRLEARIRAQSDLENARTTVAAARALKNASAMLADDPTVLFLQYLETLTKIAETGNHTFHVEGMPRLGAGPELRGG